MRVISRLACFMVLAMMFFSVFGCCRQEKKVVLNTPCPKSIEGEENTFSHGTLVQFNIIDQKEIGNGENQSSL